MRPGTDVMNKVHGINGMGNDFGNKDALKSKNIKGHQFEGKVRDHLKSPMHFLWRMWPVFKVQSYLVVEDGAHGVEE